MLHIVGPLLGFDWGSEKEEQYTANPVSCGVCTDLSRVHSHQTVDLSVKAETRNKVHSLMLTAIEKNSLSPADAASLAGKCRFILTFTQFGRAALKPLRDRQYSQPSIGPNRFDEDAASSWPLDAELRSALQFLIRLFDPSSSHDLSLRINLLPSSRPPVLIWSDASFAPTPGPLLGLGQIGYVVAFRSAWDAPLELFYSSAVVPNSYLLTLSRYRSQKTFITPLEVAGILAPYATPDLSARLHGQDVLHFADNQAANFSAIKGYSKAPDIGHLVTNLHLSLTRLNIRFWLEYVRSKSNIADDPSRAELSRLRAMGGTAIPFVLPTVQAW